MATITSRLPPHSDDKRWFAVTDGTTSWLQIDLAPSANPRGRWHFGVVPYGGRFVDVTKWPIRPDEVDRYAALHGVGALPREWQSERCEPFQESPWVRPPAKVADDRAVYFIEGGGLIKIGVGDPRGRLERIRTMSPVDLHLLGWIPGLGREGEAELHRRFAGSRSHGEWFWPTAALLDLIHTQAVAA